MAKRSQAAKRHRQSLKKQARNYAYRSRLRTFVKQARQAIATGTEDREELVSVACRELDRMVSKGVIHKNNASRKKSRLMTALHGKAAISDTGAPATTKDETETDLFD